MAGIYKNKKKMVLMVIGVCGMLFFDFLGTFHVRAEEENVIDPSQLYAQSAVLMDAESGRILFEKEGGNERPMASTTKIMTCILALEMGEKTDIVTVSEKAAAQPEVHLGMKKGDQFYLEDLLYSLMLESHNDSAWAIAEHISGSVEAFTDLMDQKAEEIGCSHTNFVTPNGLDGKDGDGNHRTTAAELAKIMKYCIMESPKREEFLKITRTRSKIFQDTTGKKQYSCTNHNAFLDMMDEALTGKTGFTGEAGYCYVGAVRKDDRTFIVALLACGWPNNKNYKWSDMKTLAQYGIDNYQYYYYWEEASDREEIKRLEAGKKRKIKDAVTENGSVFEDGTVTTFLDISSQDMEKRILKKTTENIEIEIQEKENIQAPLEKKTNLGKVKVKLNGTVLDQKTIISGEKVYKKDLAWIYRNLWKLLAI